MAIHYWQGSTGNPNTSTNWSNGSVPVDGDTIIFLGPPLSNVAVTSSFSSEKHFALIDVAPGYTSNICMQGAEFSNVTADKISMRGTGSFYLKSPNNVVSGNDFGEIIVNSANPADALIINGATDGQPIELLKVRRGGVQLTSTHPLIDEMYVYWTTSISSDTRVLILDSDSHINTAYLYGGRVECHESINTIVHIYGGEWRQVDGAVEEAHISGGKMLYESDENIDLLVLGNGGEFNSLHNRHAFTIGAVRQITNRSNLKRNESLHTITLIEDMSGEGLSI